MEIRNGILLILALALAIPGCSKKEEDEKLGLESIEFHIDWVPGVDYIGYFVADDKGFYKKEGLNVTIKSGDGAPAAAQSIASGAITVGTTTGDAIVRAQRRRNEKGEEDPTPVVAVSVIFPHNPVVLLSLASQPITTLKQLEDKKLGYHETSVTYEQFQAIAKRDNIDLSKIELKEVGWAGAAALMNGQVHATLAYVTDSPVILESRDRPYTMIRFDEDLRFIVASQCIAVSTDTATKKPSWLARFVRASIRGWEYARDHQDEAVELFTGRFATQDRKNVRIGLQKTVALLPNRAKSEVYVLGHDAKPGPEREYFERLWQETEKNIAEIDGQTPREHAAQHLFKSILDD